MSDFTRVKTVQSRKQHRCCECKGIISAREDYVKTSGVFEGGWFVYKTCFDCEELRGEVSNIYREGIEYSHLYEALPEELEERFRNIQHRRKSIDSSYLRWSKHNRLPD